MRDFIDYWIDHRRVDRRALGRRLAVWLLVAFLLPSTLLEATAQAQTPSVSPLAQAELHYLEGDFDRAVRLLNRVDKQRLPKEEAVKAYHLLTLSYFHQGNLAGAWAAMASLIQVEPNYRPDPVQAPPSQRFSHSYLRLVRRLQGQPPPMAVRGAEPLQNIYVERLQQAEAARLEGRTNEALKLARDYLNRDSLHVVERVQAYRTRGLAYAARGNEKQARKAATELIVRYPQYELSEEEKEQFPEFAVLVEEARERHETGEINRAIRRRKRLKQIAFTALGTVAAVFIVQLGVRDFTSR